MDDKELNKSEDYRRQILLKMDNTFREGIQFAMEMGLGAAEIIGAIELFKMDVHRQLLEIAHSIDQNKVEGEEEKDG